MTKARDLANAADALDDVSATELGYVNGVTSAIQTQIDSKLATATASSTYIAKSLVDAAGDLIYGSANDTVTRLGIGTAGQYLKVNSGATAPEWATLSAGAFTLLSTTTLSGSSVTISSISQSYNDLFITIDDYYASVNQTDNAYFRINNDSGASKHAEHVVLGQSNSVIFSLNRVAFAYALGSTTQNTWAYIYIPNYTSTTSWKRGFVYGAGNNTYDTGRASVTNMYWLYKDNTAVSSINFTLSANNFSAGTVKVYGVK